MRKDRIEMMFMSYKSVHKANYDFSSNSVKNFFYFVVE